MGLTSIFNPYAWIACNVAKDCPCSIGDCAIFCNPPPHGASSMRS